MDLTYGADEKRQEAFARLESIPHSVPFIWMRDALAHPADRKLQAEVLRRMLKREDIESGLYTFYARWLVENHMERGQIREVALLLQEEEITQTGAGCVLALSLSLDYPIPDSLLRSYLKPTEIEEDAAPDRLLCTGVYLMEEEREEELDPLVDRLREAGARAQAAMNELQGYRAWKTGKEGQAARLWSESKRPFWREGAIWRGDLYRDLGKLEEAEDWYMAAWRHPVAHERLGFVHEEMNRPEEAAEAYERFIEAWAEADKVLQERTEAARKRLKSLTEEGALPVPQER